MKFICQFYGLVKRVKKRRHNGFKDIEIINLTKTIDSSLSHKNISHYLKLPITIMHKELLGTVSRIPKYGKDVCIDTKKPFHFACCRWIFYWLNQTLKLKHLRKFLFIQFIQRLSILEMQFLAYYHVSIIF